MTANELADKLQNEKAKTLLYVATIVDSANMLRQQQAEIEALKKKLENLPMSLKDDIEYWSEK
jgi:Zn-dependent oligopeptidase